jgi:hypothetical protein
MYENILLTSCVYDYNGPHIYCEINVKFVSNITWVHEEPSSFLVCCDLVATLKLRVARNRNIFILRWSLQFKKGSKRTNTISCTNNWLASEAMTKTYTESTAFRDITPRRPLKFNRRFWGTNSFHIQGIRIASACNLLPWSAYVFDPEDGHVFFRNESWLSTDYKRYIPEDSVPHNHRFDSLQTYKL